MIKWLTPDQEVGILPKALEVCQSAVLLIIDYSTDCVRSGFLHQLTDRPAAE